MMTNEKNNIRKEISDIAPVFAYIEARYNCTLPDGYFSAMQQQVWEKISVDSGMPLQHKALPAWIEYLLFILKPQYSLVLFTVTAVIIASTILHADKYSEMPAPELIAQYLIEEDITMEEVISELTSDDIAHLEKTLPLAYSASVYHLYDYLLDDPDNFFTEEAL